MNWRRIVQIGDIHYPELLRRPGYVDLKSKVFPTTVVNRIAYGRKEAALRLLERVLTERPIAAIVCMGDLTSRGSEKEIDPCIGDICEAIDASLGSGGRNLLVLPGNHDVSRDKVVTADIDAKFAPLNGHLKKHGLPTWTVGVPNLLPLQPHTGLNALVVGLNSCVGCGERIGIPAAVRAALESEFPGKVDDIWSKIDAENYYDQLDSPAFDKAELDALASEIDAAGRYCVPIVTAHHNILPQDIIRVEMYTEVLNAGVVRRQLLNLNRPVLFLHGHIHDAPLEEVRDASSGDARLICVSAPLFENGLNTIDLMADGGGFVLGCIVTTWTIASSGDIRQGEERRFPLLASRGTHQLEQKRQLLDYLQQQSRVFGSDLFEWIRKNLSNVGDGAEKELVADLFWQRAIDIDPIHGDPDRWVIEIRRTRLS